MSYEPLKYLLEAYKGNQGVVGPAAELKAMGPETSSLAASEEAEDRKAYRTLWQRASSLYVDLAWGIVEAKIDASKEPPEGLSFSPEERLVVDFGHLGEGITQENPHFAEELEASARLDIYQYMRLTDFIAETYALMFDKPYEGPQGGCSLEEKIRRFGEELAATESRRRMAASMVLCRCSFVTCDEVQEILSDLESYLRIHTEFQMRTRRIREAQGSELEGYIEQNKRYEIAERDFMGYLSRAEKELPEFGEGELQKILGLHDRTKFLANLEVHLRNEEQRRSTRVEMFRRKFKGKGVPALKGELRDCVNHKKEFMTLAARIGRMDTSPLNNETGRPIGFQRAGEIMMDLTPLDPDLLRVPRVRMYGIPKVIITPGRGLGVYDWTDNSLIIPQFAPFGGEHKSFCYALAAFRWDNDEDRTLKDSYSLIKENRDKGIRALQESFSQDYFIWMTKERKGYRVLPKETSKWFRVHFKKPE
ncbi:hypothetical protein TheveDRAFT_0126 [Thermanaerovibrio velox DSM 12556]|uniref:Uncharacterized protein n=1 Tax=Thermanaerovibrio velox DSM 12556 TaxID=926567 RepID=H0UN34_9BACT|nr:hypothetical protein [Thermanaerovibrio velox]EHM09313.1 hypothetical protein TheveDRAFT_0126 [Thermanaerovibrio velox DSM 12556]